MLKLQKQLTGEVDHCRPRLMRWCRGQGLDLGSGASKIRPEAISVDLGHPNADMHMDARDLRVYPDGFFDYVFSSHLLEQLEHTEIVLREWLRVVRNGGYLVLYQVDEEYYPKIGAPECNPQHKHHFIWEKLWEILQKIGGTTLIHHARYGTELKEWSFELIVRKGKPEEWAGVGKDEGISILVPTYKRPPAIGEFTENVFKTCAHPDKVEIVFGVHAEDKPSIDRINELAAKYNVRAEQIEKDPQGVHLAFLWNQLYPRARWPIVGYFGDDVIFHTPGWDEEVIKAFQKDRFILFSCNDVHVHKGKTATLFFTHKDFHEKVGFYLHPKFRRWYTDTFWDLVFRGAGKLVYREDIFTEHLSPDVFRDRADETYKAMEKLKGTDTPIWNSMEVQEQIVKLSNDLRGMK